MPRKTITASINGKTRTIDADIPDGASPEEIEGAVNQFLDNEEKQKANAPPQQIANGVNAPTGFEDATSDKRGFLESLVDQVNPLPAIHRYLPSFLGGEGQGPPALQQMHEAEQGNLPAGPQGNILSEVGQPGMAAAGQAADGNIRGALGTIAGGYAAPVLGAKAIHAGLGAAPEIAAGTKGAISGGVKTVLDHPVSTVGAMLGGHYFPGGEILGPVLGGARLLKGMYEGAQERLATLEGKPTTFTGQHLYKPPSVGDMRSGEEPPTPRPVKAPALGKMRSVADEETAPTRKVVKAPEPKNYKRAPDEAPPSKALTTPPRIKPRAQGGTEEGEGEAGDYTPLKPSPKPVGPPTPEKSVVPEAYLNQETSGLPAHKATMARHKVANNIADHLHKTGITSEDLNNLEADKSKWGDFWKMTGEVSGSKQKNYSPSQMTIDAVRDGLADLEAKARRVKQVGQEGVRDTTILMDKIGKSLNLGQ